MTGCADSHDTPPPPEPRAAPRQATAGLAGAPFLVKDIHPGTSPSNFYDPPTLFAELGTTVLFGASDKVHGRELWRTDGSAAGTALVLDLLPGPEGSNPSHPTVLNGRMYFLAAANSAGEYGLWSTDGTPQGTVLVKPLPWPVFLEQKNGVLYVGTLPPDSNASAGFALWKSDGTSAGATAPRPAPRCSRTSRRAPTRE
jgi:ELWxxDGT repeat protein